jgi:hypothetical protein
MNDCCVPPAMNTKSAFFRSCIVGVLMLIFGGVQASAQVDATSWTSVGGTTIWARLDGLEGDKVILNLRGKTYRVPITRLAPKSIDKACRMLNTTPEKIRATAAVSRPRSGAVVASGSTPRKIEETPLPIKELEIAALPSSAETGMPVPATAVTTVSSGMSMDDTGLLPDLSAAVDATADGYGAVLPARDSVVAPASQFAGSHIRVEGRRAIAPMGVPSVVLTAIEAGNRLQTKYYKWGGGRARLEDTGYDCSGSVSYVLIKAGLLRAPITSGTFTRYGASGPGKWITIHARNGHVFMTICGLRLDTGGHGGRGESGPRWCTHMRGTSGFVMRHPPGF